MIMKPLDRLSRSKKGQMPFAMIAVALLLMGTAYGIVCANIQNSEDEAENLSDEFQAMDDAIDDNKEHIESGLGAIICDLSSSANGGTLLQRMDSFKTLSEEWLSDNYPFCNRGVTATIVSQDLHLNVETMKLSSGDVATDSSKASFLRCTGTVTVHLTNSTGETEKELEISADGTSSLPFIAGSASEFELSSAGGTSILSQLMNYQLSALAQSRVINGYGAFSAYGEYGVNSIITDSDVREAFRNSLSIIETICFRDNAENDEELVKSLYVDAAELIVLNDGYFEIDMSSIVAQVLSSMFDDILGKWLDFILGDSFLDIADEFGDEVLKTLYNIVEICKAVPGLKEVYNIATSIFPFLEDMFGSSDEETDSAVRYIRDAMEDAGYSEDDYRYIKFSRDYHFYGYETTIEFTSRTSSEEMTFTYDPTDFTVDFETDIFDWDGWSGFITDYLDKTNAIAEMIKSILNTIFAEMADSYGVYRIPADEFDSKDFLKTYEDALNTAVSKGLSGVEYFIGSSLTKNTVHDPFYASIYMTMVDHQNEIFECDYFDAVEDAIKETLLEKEDRGKYYKGVIEARSKYFSIMCSPINPDDGTSVAYQTAVSDHLKMFDSVLNSVVNSSSNALTELIVKAGKHAIDTDLISSKIRTFCNGLIDDTINNISLSTYSGVQNLDGLSSYMLYDYDGNVKEEFVDVKDNYDLSISITTPMENSSKNIHAVNPEELTYMPFTSVFTVRVSTVLNYSVTSASSVDMALGKNDAAISGSFTIDATFDVTCVSGWELAGVHYSPSTNLGEYLMSKLAGISDYVMESLSSIFKSAKDVYNILSSNLLEAQERLNEIITMIYNSLMTSIERVEYLIESGLTELLVNAVEEFDIGLCKESITVNYFGLKIKVEFFVATYCNKTMKHVMKMSLEGKIGDADISAFIDIKQNEEKQVLIKGGAGVEIGDFNIDISIDPLLKFGKKVVSANGSVRGLDFDIALPERELYEEVELRLSDIPAIGTALNNIILPIAGAKASIDAGVELKFNLPIGTGLMINEFESNPKGTDSGNEWVEIYNATAKTIDLTGYAVVPRSNENKALMLSGSISPFEHKVFYFEGQSLINTKSGRLSGESLSLIDPNGIVVDKTPAKKDSTNDENTWQRKTDGDSSWVFNYATEGTSNGTRININSVVKTFFVDTLVKAAEEALCDMGNHLTTVDEIITFLQHMLKLYIEKIIDKIKNMIVGASVFFEVEIQDTAETVHKGFTIAFEIGSELVEEGLHWLLRQIPFLSDFVQKPSSNDPIQIICENSYFTVSSYSSVSAPKFLKLDGMEVKMVGRVGVNVCGLTELLGTDTGKWKVYAGIMIEDIDPKILPAGLRSNQDKSCDLWLIKMVISE